MCVEENQYGLIEYLRWVNRDPKVSGRKSIVINRESDVRGGKSIGINRETEVSGGK